MKYSLALLLTFSTLFTKVYAQPETPQKALNQYVEFLNQSADMLTSRFQMLGKYQDEINLFKKKPDYLIRLPSSGPLEEYYYQKALMGNGLTATEKQQLDTRTKVIWQLLTQLDQTGKALETYIHLKSYQGDNLKQSDKNISELQVLFDQFRQDKDDFYNQIKIIYRRYQSYLPTDPYSKTEQLMAQVLLSQQQLLESLPYYLNEENRSDWPAALVQQSMLADEKLLLNFEKTCPKLPYPASGGVNAFKSAISVIQNLKRQAIDDNNFAAKQSVRHGNEIYMRLINQYNKDLLASHKAVVNYSKPARQMLDYPEFSPVFKLKPASLAAKTTMQTQPFEDKNLPIFSTKKALSPASSATLSCLNDYVEFINEGLWQMHLLQVLLRNYQASAEYHRDPVLSQRHSGLTYSHDDFKTPVSAYQLLINASSSIPQPYREAVNNQTEVLLNILKEMDGLSIELTFYTSEKQYLQDHLKRSDVILDRYAHLFDIFDQKKEQLYNDVRRIHESYPNANPTSSWYVAGTAMLKTMDDDKEILFGVKSYLSGETTQIPNTEKLEKNARQLIADEYQNLKGLQRFGRSNGLCPYSPYEDLAGNSYRLAEKTQKIKIASSGSTTHSYESFYYFYNNELIYQYNKFTDLAKLGLLKMVNQPDVFAFRRLSQQNSNKSISSNIQNDNELAIQIKPVSETKKTENFSVRETKKPEMAGTVTTQLKHDTVYVERVRIDTVYVNQGTGQQKTSRTLDGFAANNMVLLLDVSASMDSPLKLPLLKRSIKSLLTLLRPEDQISIVVYSGKARIVLKPTSGIKAAEISRMIDLLRSNGDTDGNEGLRLAYKVVNKEYIRTGNNRIILATDGEFPVSKEVLQMIGENAHQDVYLTVFTFGKNLNTGQKLKKLSQLGQGTYAHVTSESADLQLILEAQAKKKQLD